jgi:hypothetical protein
MTANPSNHQSGKSLQKIADWLNQQGYTTHRGHPWQGISVKRVLDRLYGKPFRTPRMSAPAEQNARTLPAASSNGGALNR